MRYRRPKRSYSAMVRSISSRAASAAERMPWTRSLKSSGLEAPNQRFFVGDQFAGVQVVERLVEGLHAVLAGARGMAS